MLGELPLGKRLRSDSGGGSSSRPHHNRPRATDIPTPVHAAPASWAMLTAQIEYASTYTSAVANTIRNGVQSMRSEDLSSRIVTRLRENPLPKFPFIPKNTRIRPTPTSIAYVYRMLPTILTSSNARETCAGDPPFDLSPTGSYIPPPANSTFAVNLSAKSGNDYRPLCRQPKIARSEDVVRFSDRSFVLEQSIHTEIRGDFLRFHEQDLAFAQEMGRLYIISPQNIKEARVDPEHAIPHALLAEMYTLMHRSIIRHLLNTEYAEPSDVIHGLNDFYRRHACANACADIVLLRALDACAILGGVKLPSWPPNKEWIGAVIEPRTLPFSGIEPTEDGAQLLSTIRRLERWGVPLWCFSITSTNQRLDITPHGLPSEDANEEASFQGMLRNLDMNLVRCKHVLNIVQRVHTEDMPIPGYKGLPTGPQRLRLQHAITSLLDYDSPTHLTFASFSAIVADILGSNIWSGHQHEAGLHPASFDTSQPMPWNRVRDAIRECAHWGVNIALFQIPLPWINPSSSVASPGGQYTFASQNPSVSLVATPCATWFTLEVDDFQMDDQPDVCKLAETFKTTGLFAWSFVQSGLQKKDEKGKTIPRSRFTARFLFKQQHVREIVENNIIYNFPSQERRSKDEVNVRDDVLFNYSFFFHPHFVDVAYAEPISHASRLQVMALAPPFDVIPASIGSTDRASQVKRVVHSLRYFELFETAKFPPIIASSSRRPTLSPVGLDMCSCTLTTLRQLASSAVPHGDLSFMDVCRMQRFAYMLDVLAKDGPFMSQVFRSRGPYLKILRYLSITIRDTSPPGSSFSPHSNRVDVGPYHEAVRLTSSQHVEIILNLDVSERDIQLPTEAEIVKWNNNVERMWDALSNKRSRSEKRHDKEQRRISKAVATHAAGPSRS